MSAIEERLKDLGIELPDAPAAVGAYVPVVVFGNMAVTSGQLPFVGKTLAVTGKVGDNVSVEDGAKAARIAAINALAQLKGALGSLERIQRVVRVEGYVNSAPGFHAHATVMNGASNLIAQVLGDVGSHTRIAVGASELPLDATVEVVVWATIN